MIKNQALRSELAALARAQDWAHLRSWFSYWKDLDEQVDKFILWAHFFLPHYFRDQTPPFHRNLAKRFFSKRNEYTAAPRGFSKTTLLQAGILFDCVNELEEFIALVEKTFTEGGEVLEAVRNECVTNELLIKVYGDLLATEKTMLLSRAVKSKDSEGDLFVNGVRLRAKGFDQPIRGLKSREWRPTKILCQPKGSRVVTRDGMKDISEIVSGDMVLTHRGRFCPVLQADKLAPKKIYEAKMSLDPTQTRFSEGHLVYARAFGGSDNVERFSRYCAPMFLPVECLKKHDVIGYPIDATENLPTTVVPVLKRRALGRDKSSAWFEEEAVSLTEDESYLLGAYLGDGSLHGNGLVFYLNSDDKATIEKISRAGKTNLIYRKGSVTKVYVCSMKLLRIARKWKRKKNSHKVMGSEFERFPLAHQQRLFDGYCDTDGYRTSGVVRITSVCLPLLEQWQRILLRFGIIASIRKGILAGEAVFPNGWKCKTQPKYDLYVPDKRGGSRVKNTTSWIKGGYLWHAVSEIGVKNTKETVYSLKVAEDSSYCTHLVANHNCDDVEQDQHINSVDQRKKYEDNYNKGIQPAVDRDGFVKVFGTILHMDSLLMNLIKLHDGRIFRAYYLPSDGKDWEDARAYTTEIVIDGVGPVRVLWQSRWSWEQLMRKKADMVSKNQSSNAFEQEYRNNPIAEEERKFKWEWLHDPDRSIKLSELFKKGLTLVGYATIDCADSKNEGSDSTAAVVTFVDPNGNWYRVDVRNEKRNIKELLDLIFHLWTTWSRKGLVKIGVEKKAYNDQVRPLLEQEIRRRNVFPVVEELKPMGRAKEDRILGALQGRYEYGKIWTVIDDVTGLPVGATDVLLDQLYNFPSSAHDDVSDAEAYISDIASVPLEDEKRQQPHRDPSDDPWRGDRHTGKASSEDPYEQPDHGADMVDTDADPYS